MFGSSRQLAALAEDLAKAQRRLDEVEASLRARDLEYEELLDKVHRWMQRTSARVRAEGRELAPPAAREQDTVDPVSRAILNRRARVPTTGGALPEGES